MLEKIRRNILKISIISFVVMIIATCIALPVLADTTTTALPPQCPLCTQHRAW